MTMRHSDERSNKNRSVTLMAQEFAAIEELCSSLGPEDWDKPTELPGWSVKDNLSHLCGIESWLLGRERPDPVRAPHVRTDMGAFNEGDVELRRSWPAEKVLQEFRDLTKQRVEVLESLDEEALAAPAMTPVGPGTMRDLLDIRVLDCWYHEQDIRRATGKRGHLSGPIPTMIAKRMLSTLGATVGKRAQAPEGSVVVFDIPNLLPKPLALEVTGGRASIADPPSHEPNVTLRMTGEAFLRFCGGRWDVEAAVLDGRVAFHGDEGLARRILAGMPVTP